MYIYTFLTFLPTYFQDILGLSVAKSGYLSATPFFIQHVVTNITGYFADQIRVRHILNTTQTRKVFNTIGLIGAATFLAAVILAQCNTTLVGGKVCGFLVYLFYWFISFNGLLAAPAALCIRNEALLYIQRQ